MACLIDRNISCPSCGDVGSKGGLVKEIYIFNFEDLIAGSEVSQEDNGLVTGINLDPYAVGYKWCGVKAVNGSSSFNNFTQEFAPEILAYNQSVIGRFRPAGQDDLNTLDNTKGGTFLIVVETVNKKFRVFGLDGGLDLSALTENSGTAFTDDSAVNLTFSSTSDSLAPFFGTDYASAKSLLESYLA